MTKNSQVILPIILCGGSGKRLWPISNAETPKQFVKLFNNSSLLDLTIERAELINTNNITLIGSKKYKKNLLKTINKFQCNFNLIFEEEQKNTTAAIYFSVMSAYQKNKNSYVVIMPSDHFIPDGMNFNETILSSLSLAENSSWVVFGVPVSRPSTSYGYIKTQKKDNKRKFVSFIEKPNQPTAKILFKDKNYYWNSGVFFGKSKKILESIESHANDIFQSSKIAWQNRKINDDYQIIQKEFSKKIRSESIDFAVLEKERSVAFLKMKCYWNDIGSWDSISELQENNTLSKFKDLAQIESKNISVYSDKGTVSTIGLKDIIIINHRDNILIIKKGETEKVKSLLEQFSTLEDKY